MRRGLAGLILLSGLAFCMLASPAAYSQTQPAASQTQPAASQTQPPAAPSYDALADLLQDKQSRDALIKQLRSLAKESTAPASKQPGESGKKESGIASGSTAANRSEEHTSELQSLM